MGFIKAFYKQHKPELVQALKTILVLILIVVLRRLFNRVLPAQVTEKLRLLHL